MTELDMELVNQIGVRGVVIDAVSGAPLDATIIVVCWAITSLSSVP